MFETLKKLVGMDTFTISLDPTHNPIVHNYTTGVTGWGRDISYHPVEGTVGKTYTMRGFSSTPILVGDYILLSAQGNWNVRYRVTEIKFENDPADMFFGKMEFVNRTDEQKACDLTKVRQNRLNWLDDGGD